MTGMRGFRNRHFRRWVAGGLAVLWLFTVLACAADTDASTAAPAHSPQFASSAHSIPVPPPGDGTQDDACCQAQASAVVGWSAVKLPYMTMPAVTMPLALLLVLALPYALLGMSVVSDPSATKRRSRLLVHSLQPQAPPR